MNSFKKKMFFVCALCIAAAGLAGCGEKKAENENQEPFSGTLTYWAPISAQASSYYTTLAELPEYIEFEKRTGVHIDFVNVPLEQEQEKFTLMIASNNMTDLIETNWKRYYQGGISKALQDGIILELDSYIDSSAPNFKKIMEDYDDARRSIVTSEGHYGAFPMIRRTDEKSKSQLKTNFGGMMIRKDLLEKAGLEIPETIAEWDTVLHKFKEMGIKYPLVIESGWFKPETTCNNFNNAFGVDIGWFVENNKVKFAPMEEGYKDYIALMNKWYSEGLLCNEFDTISTSTTVSEFIQGNVGSSFSFLSTGMGKILNSAELKPGIKLAGTQYPVMNKGDEPYFMNRTNFVSTPYLAVSSSCKYPEEAVKWADYLYSDEGSLLNYYGIEGETYTKIDDENIAYTDAIMNAGIAPGTALAKYVRGYTSCPGIVPKVKSVISKYDKPEMQEAYELYNKYCINQLEKQIPDFEYPTETAESVSALEFDINSYVYENVIRYIKGTEPMENFGKFIKELEGLNVQELIDIKQKAYDEYMNK